MKKTVYRSFDYTQCGEFATFLSDMAAQGWHFKEWSLGLVFERGEAKQVEYAVEIFIHGKDEDMRPEPQTEEFAEYCEAAGWKFVDAKRKFCIFEKLRDDAVEIVTPEERVENIKEAQLGWLKGKMSLGLVLLISVFVSANNNVSRWAFDGMEQTLLFTILFHFVFVFSQILRLKKWAKEQEEVLDLNEEIVPLNIEKITKIVVGILIAINCVGYCILKESYIGLVVIIGLFICFGLVEILVRKFRPSRQGRDLIGAGLLLGMIAVVVIVSTIITEKDTGKIVYENNVNKSIFGTREIGYYKYDDSQTLSYTKYHSKIEWILDKVWKEETKYVSDTLNADDVEGAEAIEALADWMYIIRSPECVVVIKNAEGIPWEEIRTILEEIGIR